MTDKIIPREEQPSRELFFLAKREMAQSMSVINCRVVFLALRIHGGNGGELYCTTQITLVAGSAEGQGAHIHIGSNVPKK